VTTGRQGELVVTEQTLTPQQRKEFWVGLAVVIVCLAGGAAFLWGGGDDPAPEAMDGKPPEPAVARTLPAPADPPASTTPRQAPLYNGMTYAERAVARDRIGVSYTTATWAAAYCDGVYVDRNPLVAEVFRVGLDPQTFEADKHVLWAIEGTMTVLNAAATRVGLEQLCPELIERFLGPDRDPTYLPILARL
jgi:hypothetical protein